MMLRRALATALTAALATGGIAALAVTSGTPSTPAGPLSLAAVTGCANEPDAPTYTPTASPTTSPSSSPTTSPTTGPTTSPTAGPTPTPTSSATARPSRGGTATASPTTGSPTTSPTPSGSPTPTVDPEPVTSIEVVQANIKSGTPFDQFSSDLRKVFKTCPDFVTYNEVPMRQPQYLAPPGYAIWRTPGQYTGATPVVWRTDRWAAEARGTTMISNLQGYGRGQHVMWGVRYANWVTLRSYDGRQTVSLVSVHIAPKSERTTKLLAPSIGRLGALVGQLSASGPVLVGGDFNRHYKSSEYPRTLLSAAGLNAVYDLSGHFAPTGDHFGATIDYVMVRPAASFSVLSQTTRELYSDHDALVVDLSLPERTVGEPTISFSAGTSVNDPASTLQRARSSVVRAILTALRNVPEGGELRVQTSALVMKRIAGKLLEAARRGVAVKVVTGTLVPTAAEQWLTERFADVPGSFVRHRPTAFDPNAPTTSVLASVAGVTPWTVLDVPQALSVDLVDQRVVLQLQTTKRNYQQKLEGFDEVATEVAPTE